MTTACKEKQTSPNTTQSTTGCSEYETLQIEIALLRQEISALAHATGARRFEPEYYREDEIAERLEEAEMTDVYAEITERINTEKGDPAEMIYKALVEGQKRTPGRTFFRKTTHIQALLGLQRRASVIKYMQIAEQMYPEQIVLDKICVGRGKGSYVIRLSDAEIKKTLAGDFTP